MTSCLMTLIFIHVISTLRSQPELLVISFSQLQKAVFGERIRLVMKIGKALGIGTGTVQRVVMEQPRPFDVDVAEAAFAS